MACTRIADWFEKRGGEDPSPEWEELMVHSKSCAECSLILKQRRVIFETMRALPDPEFPPGLHGDIMDTIALACSDHEEKHPEGIIDGISSLLTGYAKFGSAVAVMTAVIVIVSLILPSGKPYEFFPHVTGTSGKTHLVKKTVQVDEKGSLVKLSPDEVKEFMRRLEEYRKLHPEMEIPTAYPGARLVGSTGR